MYREVSITSLLKNYYLIGVIAFMSTLYWSLYRLFVFNPEQPTNKVSLGLFGFLQISFAMLIWSMIRVIWSDPGKVPLYYGTLMDDSETKKRRYCLICHIFKPDRCHHCSTCRRCVLNMDHHCPWIGNCVGYQNRKFFMLFLFYINITVCISLAIVLIQLIPNLVILSHMDTQYLLITILQSATFMTICIFGVMIFNFMRFHISLVSDNRTTIDTLEQKRNPLPENTPHVNPYDVGMENNWYQVFGRNKWIWPFPIFAESGRPIGDGVHWDRSIQTITSEPNQQTHQTVNNIKKNVA